MSTLVANTLQARTAGVAVTTTKGLNVGGACTATSFVGDGSSITGLANTDFINATQLNVIGVATASSFVGNVTGNASGTAGGLTGTPDITVNNIVGVAATFTGVLTYEDVTNVDSVGIITARSGIEFGAAGVGGTITAVGNAEFVGITTIGSDLSISDKIIHTGDTNTAIRFPAADTITAETGGTERVRIDSSGNLGVGENAADVRLHVKETIDVGYTLTNAVTEANNLFKLENPSTTANAFSGMQLRTGNGADMFVGLIQQSGNAGDLYVTNQNSPDKELVRIKSTGSVGIGTDSPDGSSLGSNTGLLHLKDIDSGNTALKVQHGSVHGYFAADNDDITIAVRSNHFMQFQTNSAERLRITSIGGFSFNNAQLVERVKITAGKLSDNTNIDLENGMVHYFTTQETTTSTPNIRVNGSTTLNSVMDAGDVITVTLITTAAAGGYSANLTIDGNAVTEEWVGGSAPSAGGSDGLDIHSYTIICTHATNTGDSGFKVIGNLTNATN